jgi:hypothetical protein
MLITQPVQSPLIGGYPMTTQYVDPYSMGGDHHDHDHDGDDYNYGDYSNQYYPVVGNH